MTSKRILACLITASVLVFSACNLPITMPEQGNVLATAVAQTLGARTDPGQAPAGDSNSPGAVTPTDTPTATPTLPPPMVSVSLDTNCRSGPGKIYDMTGSLLVGQTAEVIGREAGSQYWVIRDPKNPANICWVWGYYATITGDTARLPVFTPPPTPTPAPSFDFAYKAYGVGPGYQCFLFTVNNTGSVTWESYAMTFKNDAHGTSASASSDQFIGYDQWCVNTGSQADLMPGENGIASVKTTLAYNPAGQSFDVSLKLCSANVLGGTCLTKTMSFTP